MASNSRTGFPISPGLRPGHPSSRAILGRGGKAVKPELTARKRPRSVAAWRTRHGSTRRSPPHPRLPQSSARTTRARSRRGRKRTVRPSPMPTSRPNRRSAPSSRRAFPATASTAKKLAAERLDAEHVWLVDPIDGTKSFVRGYPMFSTQIAVMHRGRLELGVSSAPAYGETAWAERGAGAFLGGERLAVSRIARLEEATLSTGNLRSLARGPRWAAFGRLVAQPRPHPRLRRLPALPPAGGREDRCRPRERHQHSRHRGAHGDRRGSGWPRHRSRGCADRPRTRSILATNGALHEAILGALNS